MTTFARLVRTLAIPLTVIVALSACASAGGTTSRASAPSGPAGADDHLLPVRHDTATGRVLLTILRPGEDMLYLNTLATGLGSMAAGLDRGQTGSEALVRFERRGARVLLVQRNTAFRAASGDEALRRSVEEAFPQSVLASFAIEEDGKGGITVDATDFLLSDVYGVAGQLRNARLGAFRSDRDRSYIDGAVTRSFTSNTEIRSVLTYVSDDPGADIHRHAPDGRSITLQQHHSFVRLPDPPLAMRPFDPRAGLFPISFFDFAQPFDADYRSRGVVRWRLEPRDPAAYVRGETVEPVTPIVYYMDPAIPEPYRSAFIDGGRWWNEVFEAAGWRNAFRIEPLPADADPMDARYPVIYWVHRTERGPSVGPSYRDPRTGEIIGTVVRMDSYRSLVDHDIYMGLVPAAGAEGLQLTAEQFSMARRRQHAAHEIGHTLGLAHNFIAATQDRASVMDYPYPLVRLDPQGRLDISEAYRASPGPHDILAIRYAYTWYPDAAAEAAGLRQLVRDAEAQGLRFVADAHAGAAGSIPGASQWVEGADMLSALERTMAVRRLLIDRFDTRAAQPGEALAVLNRRFAHVYFHHRYALTGAIKYIGGMDFGYAIAGEPTVTTRIAPPDDQRAALQRVLGALAPAELRIPDRVTTLLPPVPFGYDADLTLVPTPAGTAFDPLAAAHSLAQEILNGILHPERAARLVSFNARDTANPGLDEVLAAMVDATWGRSAQPDDGAGMDASLRRIAQRATLDAMLDLAASASATAQVRAITGDHLTALARQLATPGATTGEERGHRATAARDIERYLEGRLDPAARPRPAHVPLPWP